MDIAQNKRHLMDSSMKRILFLILLLPVSSDAQEVGRRFELRATAGRAAFDEDHGAKVFGAALRYSIADRLGIEPEVLYMVFDEGGFVLSRRVVVTPHLSLDFRRNSRIRPYLIGGVGWQRYTNTTRYASPNYEFSGNDWTWNAGFGVKMYLTPRAFLAPDFRFGQQPVARLTASIGFTF